MTLPNAILWGLALALSACGVDAGGNGSEAPRDVRRDAEPPAPDAAAAPDAEAPAVDAAPPTHTQLSAINALSFTRALSPGVAPGFNLDDRISDQHDSETCNKPDFTSPEGEPGIDNQLATLVPLFETVGIGAVEQLVQNSIKEGGLLIMLEIAGLTDAQDTAPVTVRLRLGQGTPLLGTDGLLLSGQTFHVHPDSEDVVVDGARVSEGVLDGGPFEARLPIVVFGQQYVLPLHNTRLRARLTYDGGLADGVLGGEVALEDIITLATQANMNDQHILPAVQAILGGKGDLDRGDDGKCKRISGTFAFTAVSAFFFQDE